MNYQMLLEKSIYIVMKYIFMKNYISPVLENYIETIYILNKKYNTVRVKDLAEVLNVKPPSVNEALTNL